MTTARLTPKQFVQACVKVFPDLEPDDVASLFTRGSLPSTDDIAEQAEAMADAITPHESTLATHARILEIHEWASR